MNPGTGKRSRGLRRACALALAAWCAAVGTARSAAAQEPRFDARLVPAGAALAVSGALALAPTVLGTRLPYATCAPCDRASLPGFDRGAVGAPRAGPGAASHVTLLLTGLGAAAWLRDERGPDAAAARGDLAVLAQAVGAAAAATEWTKVIVHRARPVRYTEAGASLANDAESGRSLPSAHAAVAFAAAAAYWTIESRTGRAHDHRGRIATLFAAAAATGVLRVVARKHFPSDVVAGAALGTAVGIAVVRLYPMRR